MELNSVIEQANAIFIRELDNEAIRLSYETTANDIEEWDSLTHIQLIVAIEEHFKIRFSAAEIGGFENVGKMCEAIRLKQSK